MEFDDSIEFTGDYTDEEKDNEERKKKRAKSAKKAAETRKKNKEKRDEENFKKACERNGWEEQELPFDCLDESISLSLNENINLLLEKKRGKKRSKRKSNNNKRHLVLQWLTQPEVNCAEIRRQLEGEPENQEEEDSKRSYFMKKVHQTDGKSFTDKEITNLYSLKTSLGQ